MKQRIRLLKRYTIGAMNMAAWLIFVLLVCSVTLAACAYSEPEEPAPPANNTTPVEQVPPVDATATATEEPVDEATTPAEPEPLDEAITPAEPEPQVKNVVTVLARQAKTVDWSHKNSRIVFGKWGMDWYVDVFMMNPDGSEQKCLTCSKPGCPQKHNGNPAWHPSGDYIVFTAEKEDNPEEYAQWAMPGSGFNCDLWVMTSDGEEFYQLTDYPLHTRGVIHPHFSHDGNNVLWAERLGRTEGSTWGEWALRVADFVIGDEGPYLKNIKTYQPGKQHYFYESHAFSTDDKRILFCGNPDGQSDVGFDIYEMDLETEQLTNLTLSPDDWDEHAQYSPDGKKIAWMSSTGFDIDFKSIEGHDWMKYLRTELWIMNADGSNKQRLTYFNEPGYPEYMAGKRCIVSDISWSPDGQRVIVLVAYQGTGFAGLKAKLVVVQLE